MVIEIHIECLPNALHHGDAPDISLTSNSISHLMMLMELLE